MAGLGSNIKRKPVQPPARLLGGFQNDTNIGI